MRSVRSRAVVCLLLGAGLNGLAPPVLCDAADTIKILDQEMQSYWARIEMIKRAKKKISASYYIVAPDGSGTSFLNELVNAAKRGVQTQLIIDSYGSPLGSEVLFWLRANGVELKVFSPVDISEGIGSVSEVAGKQKAFAGLPIPHNWLHPFRTARYRMHDKLLLVDGEAMITGGRNMADEYFGKFIDLDVLVRAKDQDTVITDAQRYFDELWKQRYVETPDGMTVDIEKLKRWQGQVDFYAGETQKAFAGPEARELVRTLQSGVFEIQRDKLEFLHDPSTGKRKRGPGMAQRLWSFIAGAQNDVKIVGPYWVFNPETKKVAIDLMKRKIAMEFTTNSISSTDAEALLVATLSRDEIRKAIKMGAVAKEAEGVGTLHMKLAIVDGNKAYVGTYNFDPRSYYFNTEIGLLVDDLPFVQELERIYKSIPAKTVGADVLNEPAGVFRYFQKKPKTKEEWKKVRCEFQLYLKALLLKNEL